MINVKAILTKKMKDKGHLIESKVQNETNFLRDTTKGNQLRKQQLNENKVKTQAQ